MPELKRKFQSGKMNKDLDERLVPNGEYRDALNVEVSTSESDDLGSVQTIMGNKLIGADLGPPADIDIGFTMPNPSATDIQFGAWPQLAGNWDYTYRNKTVGKVVDEGNNWAYRLVAGPPPMPIVPGSTAPFDHQVNIISADYIVRNNEKIEEPVLVDIHSVAVGRAISFPVPGSPQNIIEIPDARGLRPGMELNNYINSGGGAENIGLLNTSGKKPPKIVSISQVGTFPDVFQVDLTGKINFSNTYANNLVFTAPRVLNFEHDNLITGINIFDDFLLWTDNHTEPKKIHIEKSVLGCRHPFTWNGTNPFSYYHHTNFVTKIPLGLSWMTQKFWLGYKDASGIPVSAFPYNGGRPIKERHITVIKESPYLTPVLEMVKDRGDINTEGRVVNKDLAGAQGGPRNPFFDASTTSTISIDDEMWINFGGPHTNSEGFYDVNGVLQLGPGPELVDPTTGLPNPGCSPVWTPTCSIDFSIVPFYEAGDIIIFSSGFLEIRAEILLGPDWNYGSYKVRIISLSGGIAWTDLDWRSEKESIGTMFQYKFPRFATRYKYEDGEYSTYSPFTEVAFLPDRNPMDYLAEKGYNLNMTNNLKELAIKGFIPHDELLPDDVESIEIVYKESDSSNIYSVTTIDRDSEKWFALDHLGTNSSGPGQWNLTKGYVKIMSEMIQGTIDPKQLLRPWDAVPRKALGQEITGNRLLYGNYLQNYNLSTLDKVNCGPGSNIECIGNENVEASLHFRISGSKHVGVLQPEEESVKDVGSYGPAKSIKTLRTYQLGIIYRDKYGRETPVFSNIDMSRYHEKEFADKSSHFGVAVKNLIPDFAESFKFFIKETSNDYYNLPMDRWYYAEDGNIWLSFPSSERSKISVNSDEERFDDTFIILKKEHDNTTFVADPARYKVLAIENDAPTFIKTVKTPLGVLTGLGSAIFDTTSTSQGFPTIGNNFIRIPTADFENQGWDDTVIGPSAAGFGMLKMRIGTDVIKSSWYNIISAAAITNAQEYEIKVDGDFGGDMVFATTDTLSIEIIKEEVKYLPEFDGRFFVKIYKDLTLEENLLQATAPPTGSYGVTSSMLCQVIDPNSAWSDVNHADYTTSDGWDGWGTLNDSTNPAISTLRPLHNHQTGFVAFRAANSNAAANAPAITGPDWAISSNATTLGLGEQYWQGFEAQDALFGSGNASRWFIDGRSGVSQMFQRRYRGADNWADSSGNNFSHEVGFELDQSGAVLPTVESNQWGKPTTWFNGVISSIPNNPTVNQYSTATAFWSTPQCSTGLPCAPNLTGRPDLITTNVNTNAVNWLGQASGSTWWASQYGIYSETDPNDTYNSDAAFKSPSEGIYTDANGDIVYIDLSCMGFGGPENNANLTNWNVNRGLPYSNSMPGGFGFAANALVCNTNCNSAFLSANAGQYAADVIFINAITTPGALWRWAEDPDQTIYQTQNSNTIISDWANSGGTLGGWKRVGETSLHLNTQTIGMRTLTYGVGTLGTRVNTGNNIVNSGAVFQWAADSNPFTTWDFPGESMSNTANWNRSQRWTIEARTLSGDELGSGPAGYLPTNDPRWSTANTNFNNPQQKAPGVRHDGMGSGETSNINMTSTIYWNAVTSAFETSATINPPSEYNEDTGDSTWPSTTSGSFTWQVLLPQSAFSVFNATGTFSSTNPAIWETEPRNNVDLDIYYEIGQIYATKLNERTSTLHIPVGSEVRIYRPQDSSYITALGGIFPAGSYQGPTGWIPWFDDKKMFVESWNKMPLNDPNGIPYVPAINPLDTTFPNEIRIVDSNGIPNSSLTTQSSPYPGDILVFYRTDGSTTEAQVFDTPIGAPLGWFNVNKQAGVFSLEEEIGNRYIRPPWFNCYSFGNGVESNRIRDDFNEVIIDKGPKASAPISTSYKEERRKNGLIFSGIFNSKTGINNLNQFITYDDITKDLNPIYGSIQKLHSRDTDIITLCEEKCLKVLANKNALYNADGNINMIATSNVLGQAVAYAGDYGIGKNPESFASASFRMYFADKSKGSILRLSQDGLTPISKAGMNDWFTDNLSNAYEIVGSIDDRKGDYNITIYDHDLDTEGSQKEIIELGGATLTFNERVKGWSSFKSFLQETGFSLNNNYYTSKHGHIWKHHVDQPRPRNTFYKMNGWGVNLASYPDPYTESSLTFLFNEQPGSVKSFGTLNYEGSQTRITQDILNTSANPDIEYYDNWTKKGWYVNRMATNLQEIDQLEFKNKEGKWFAQVKGDATTWSNDGSLTLAQRGNIDPREFSYQGLDVARTVVVAPCVLGCTDPGSSNYNSFATCDDGSCIPCIYGCMDSTACNFNGGATCQLPNSCWDIRGCMDQTALNYNCETALYNTPPTTPCSDGVNCSVPGDCNYPAGCAGITVTATSTGEIETACNTNMSPTPQSGSGTIQPPSITFSVSTDGGLNTFDYDYSIFITGQPGTTIVSGINNQPGVSYTVTPTVNPPLTPSMSFTISIMDTNGCTEVLPLTSFNNTYMVYGCTNSAAANYNSAATCDDGTCLAIPIYGCQDPLALNYDPAANADCDNTYFGCDNVTPPMCTGPGSAPGGGNSCCEYLPPVYGCMDNTTVDGCGPGCNGALNYAGPGNTVGVSPDADTPCSAANVGCLPPACTGPSSTSTYAGGDCCDYAPQIFGCMDPTAYNYDPNATWPCDGTQPWCLPAGNPLTLPVNQGGINAPVCTGPIGPGPYNWSALGECCRGGTLVPGSYPVVGCVDGAALNTTNAAVYSSVCTGTANNTIVDPGAGLQATLECTDIDPLNYPSLPISPFTSATNFFPGAACVYQVDGCTDDGGYSYGLPFGQIPNWTGPFTGPRNQWWWDGNGSNTGPSAYSTSTGIATYPGANTNFTSGYNGIGYGTANNYNKLATHEDGSCIYNWRCNSAGDSAGAGIGNIVNPGGTPNGWWTNYSTPHEQGKWLVHGQVPGGNAGNYNYGCDWQSSIQYGATPNQYHLNGDGTIDVPGVANNVALTHFFGDSGVTSAGTCTPVGPGNFNTASGCGHQGQMIFNWKFLDTANTLPTPSTGASYCPDIVGPGPDDPLTLQPGYWKRLTQIRAEKNGSPFWIGLAGNDANTGLPCPQVQTSWHTTVRSLIQEFNSVPCNKVLSNGQIGLMYYNHLIQHGMTYAQMVVILDNDARHLELQHEWCQCETWNGAGCEIHDMGTWPGKTVCETNSCCPGDPQNPKCN